jgi:phage FluMu protein Com
MEGIGYNAPGGGVALRRPTIRPEAEEGKLNDSKRLVDDFSSDQEAGAKPTKETAAGRPVRCGHCDRLLGIFIVAEGEIKCERCGLKNQILVERPRGEKTGAQHRRERL